MDEQDRIKHEVRQFLKEFKKIVVSGRGLDVVPRVPNNEALVELGITQKIRRKIILGLSVTDFCSGPEPDRDRPGDVWVFGTHVGETEVYIKLKIAQVESGMIAKCISFHKALEPLSYPFRKSS